MERDREREMGERYGGDGKGKGEGKGERDIITYHIYLMRMTNPMVSCQVQIVQHQTVECDAKLQRQSI